MSLVDRSHQEGSAEADVERVVIDAWCDTLGVDDAFPEDHFFDEGGDSLGAVEVAAYIEQELGVQLPMRGFLGDPTVAGLVRLVRAEAAPTSDGHDPLVALESRGAVPPLICFHAAAGTVTRFIPLIRALGEPRKAYGLQARGADSESRERYESFQEMVADYTEAVLRAGSGPYLLLGYSLGGLVAYEVAQRLIEAGHRVPFLGLLDSRSSASADSSLADRLTWFVRQGLQLDMDIDALAAIGDPVERTATIRAEAVARGAIDDSVSPARLANMADMYESNVRLVSEYQPQPYAGPVTLFRASEPDGEPHALGWDALAPALEIQPVPGDHFSMMRPPHAHVLARVLTEVLAALSAAPLSPEDPRDAGVET